MKNAERRPAYRAERCKLTQKKYRAQLTERRVQIFFQKTLYSQLTLHSLIYAGLPKYSISLSNFSLRDTAEKEKEPNI